ncbi:alcohol oxidase [Aureobasidium pullulans]|nr:alcohol oxidase [Aureobasidium pullulans]
MEAPKKPSRFWPYDLEGAPRCFLHALSVLCTERVYILTFLAPNLALCPHRSVVNLVHIQTPNDVRPSVVLPKNASERGVRDNHRDAYKLYAGTCREYDVIFAGGGTAACVAAGRLARADPGLSILLVEGGKNNYNDPTVVNPAMYLIHLAPGSQTALFYEANSEEALNGRKAIVPCGGMLGGGSSINFMMYTRAQGVDFDDWETEGWSANDLLPLMKRLETYHLTDPDIDQSLHGHDGPVHVSNGTYFAEDPAQDLFKAAIATGHEITADAQDLHKDIRGLKGVGVFSKWAKYISPEGKRQDAAHTYIHPLMQSGDYPNLHLLLESKVTRVLFDDNKRASGIEYIPTPSSQPVGGVNGTEPFQVKAKRMVVVSAGALGTPSVLERSGVGSKEVLEKLDIPVVSDLPDVGENYQDHHLVLYPYKTSLKPEQTLDGLLSGRKDFGESIQNQDPMLGWNGIDACSKIRPTNEEIEAMGPNFKEHWDRDFKDRPTRPVMLTGVVQAFLGDQKVLPQREDGVPQQYCTMGSKAALQDGPAAKFSSQEDRNNLPEIEYSAEDDKAIEKHVRDNVNTTWHSLGTCRMAPRDKGGVVDADLNVYGVTGLKLCDLSICPGNVGANTNNTALLVGEKAADIFARDLGLGELGQPIERVDSAMPSPPKVKV